MKFTQLVNLINCNPLASVQKKNLSMISEGIIMYKIALVSIVG